MPLLNRMLTLGMYNIDRCADGCICPHRCSLHISLASFDMFA